MAKLILKTVALISSEKYENEQCDIAELSIAFTRNKYSIIAQGISAFGYIMSQCPRMGEKKGREIDKWREKVEFIHVCVRERERRAFFTKVRETLR